MVRPPLPSEVLRRHGVDLPGHYDAHLSPRRFCSAVLLVGVGPGWLRGLTEFFPTATVFGLDADPTHLRWEPRVWCLRLDPSDPDRLRLFALDYASYFAAVLDHSPDPVAAHRTLCRCVGPDGVYLSPVARNPL